MYALLIEVWRLLSGKEICSLELIWKTWLFDHSVGDIDAESIDSELEPEVQNLFEVFTDDRVIPVEIWLFDSKEVEVPLSWGAIGLCNALPCWAAKDRLPVVGRQFPVLTLAIAEDVSLALWGAWSGSKSLLEPLVLI